MKSFITRNLKWFIAVSTILVVMAAVPTTTEAGGRWTGHDPEFLVNGHKMNIWVYWETAHTCDIEGPIDVIVLMPHDAEYEFLDESVSMFDCDGDGRDETKITTDTKVREYRGDKVVVAALINAPNVKFRTALAVKKDGRNASKCKGVANVLFRCRGVEF